MEKLSFKARDEKLNNVKSRALELTALLVVFAGFSGAVSSMLGASPLYMLLSGAAVIIAGAFIQNIKRGVLITFSACALALLILFGIFAKDVINGAKTLINNLYALSEKAQPYKYEMFAVSSDNSKLGQALALVIIGIIVSCAFTLLKSRARLFAALALCAVVLILSIYFAVLPNAVFFIILIVGAVLMIALQNGRKNLLYPIPIAIFAVIILAVFTSVLPTSKAVSNAGDSMRDSLALKTVYVSGVTVETVKQQEQEKEENGRGGKEQENEPKRPDYRVIIAILIVAAISAALLLFSKLLERLNNRRDENRKDLDSPDNSRAVTAMFRYCVRLLKAFGAVDGINFSKLEIPLSENYKSEYRKMYILFNEAAFSSHEIDDSSREEMLLFMNETKDVINEKSGLFKKLIIKYRYAL